jgi:hypothetical protein
MVELASTWSGETNLATTGNHKCALAKKYSKKGQQLNGEVKRQPGLLPPTQEESVSGSERRGVFFEREREGERG